MHSGVAQCDIIHIVGKTDAERRLPGPDRAGPARGETVTIQSGKVLPFETTSGVKL